MVKESKRMENNHSTTTTITQNIACQSDVKMIDDSLLNEILKTGLIVTGSKGCGKSNAVKIIISELLRTEKAKVKVFDSALNWLFDFAELEYQLIGDKTTLHNVDNCVYDCTLIDDPNEINSLIRTVVSVDYHNHARMKLLTNGLINKWVCYVIEEAQNIIGSNALRSRENRFWLKSISTGRNLGLSFIFITQRLSDVSAKAVERCNGYLIGKTIGDNNLRKLRSLAGKQLSWLVRDLKTGEFYYYNGQRFFMKLPLHKSNHKTIQYKPQTNGFREWFKKWIYNPSVNGDIV